MSSTVYKYRGSSTASRDIESLTNNSFFSPTSAQLNDPAEAVLNDSMIAEISESLSASVSGPCKTLLDMRHTVGIYSLSRAALDELMWAHYSESHTGFCIEYNLERLVLEAGNQWDLIDVTYSDSPPKLEVGDIVNSGGHSQIVRKLAGNKSTRWAYEDEIRLVTTRSGLNYYAESAVTAVYFGCRASVELIASMRKALYGRSVRYAQLSYRDHSYELQSTDLPYDPSLDGVVLPHSAPIAKLSIPKASDLGDYSGLHSKLLKAVELVRSDRDCDEIVLADVSQSGPREGKIFVTYRKNVNSDIEETLNWHFDPSKI